ncbi:hypothetical protein [Roseateles sp. LYH14W]|uniref:Uncharacterized protein n=1 Tax=Pelomonas parva TaxID=3299032 RepID=A0ABW7F714_9BURK
MAWPLAWTLVLGHAAGAANLAADPAAVKQLVDAVSLDVMSEAALQACDDVGAAATPQMRAAWVAWRERHQVAPLRMVVAALQRRQGSSAPSWTIITEPLRQRVLGEAAPDAICAGLAQDLQGAAMDVSAQYPQARAVAQALVQAKLVTLSSQPVVVPGGARGQVLLPCQIPALRAQQGRSWSAISEEAAARALGAVHARGRVERWGSDGDRYRLVQEQGDRRCEHGIYLGFNAEPWVGREIVLRGLVTSLSGTSITLSGAALVGDASGLTPYPLAQKPLARREVLLQRVMSPPARGLADKDLAAVVIHGEGNYSNGTRWDEDVRFLLRDGTVYRRTEMPPDQLNVAASRQLEPQRWGRWRADGAGYQMQAQDDDGRPDGGWKAEKHYAVRAWPRDTRLDGSFSRGTFSGSLVLGGTSSTRSIRFTREGRFERSYSSLSSSGTLGATLNNTMISGSSHRDGKGSSSTGGGTVGSGGGTAGAFSSRKTDDGASRRGRYQLSGYVLTLDYDDGRQERLLSFPVHGDNKTVYVGDGSLSLDN